MGPARKSTWRRLRRGPWLAAWLLCIGCDLTSAESKSQRQIAPGLEEIRLSWKRGAYSGTMTALVADPKQFQLELLTAEKEGGRRRPQEWGEEFELELVINASMYQANGRSTALMIDDGVVNNGLDHPNYAGVLAFGPKHDGLPPFRIEGKDCSGFDLSRLRAEYANLVQDYRLLDCRAKPQDWRDARAYAATAVGIDSKGRIVFAYSGSALPMREFSQVLTTRELRLRSALFTEGGAQAFLVWREGEAWKRAAEDGAEAGAPARSIPNVLGLRRQKN